MTSGLGHCIRGALVYECRYRRCRSFLSRNASRRCGLRSFVAVPLLVEQRSGVFGVLLVARKKVDGFSGSDREFLEQLGENVALASNQAQLHFALQKAYEELRDTQQAVLQQERLRALGQMASGIAHDINNAISPASLYVESILARAPGLDERTRSQLETVQRAIGDVAQTVSRMGEFYRQRETKAMLTPVNINVILSQMPDLTRARWSDLAQARGAAIEMRVEVAPDAPTIMANESELREALINLVFNAADALARRRKHHAARAPRGRGQPAANAVGHHRSQRRRRRHGRKHAQPLPGTVLHHQGRARHGARARHGLWHRAAPSAPSCR